MTMMVGKAQSRYASAQLAASRSAWADVNMTDARVLVTPRSRAIRFETFSSATPWWPCSPALADALRIGALESVLARAHVLVLTRRPGSGSCLREI